MTSYAPKKKGVKGMGTVNWQVRPTAWSAKENIEQLGVTRCFPEGRKILFFVRPSYRQAHDYDFSAKALNVCLFL
jgi:hypothetical protein